MKTQLPYGYQSRNGNPEPIRPAATWATLQTMTRGPAYLQGYGVVDRDPRLIRQNWVPWELANDVDRWTLHTNIDASTLNVGALPAGWAIAATGTGAVSVAGGEILVTSPPSSTASLTYTIAGLGATDYVMIVLSGYSKSDCDTSPIRRAQLGDSRRNKNVYFYLVYQANIYSTWYGSSMAGASPYVIAPSTLLMRWDYNIGLETTGVVSMSSPLWGSGATIRQDGWGALSATDYVKFYTSSGAGAGNTVLAVDHIAIYTGQE